MDVHFSKKKTVKYIFIIVFILTPLISAVLFCLKDGRRIDDVYMPLGGWSDEITYYKQVEGILSYGMPRGYFGYNQSKALYGTLGVWGFIPLIPYIAWGWIFGWNYTSPLFANIFFCVLALFALYKLLHCTGRVAGVISFFWITNQFLNRYVLSGVVEASVIAQLIFVMACGEYLLSDKIRGQQDRTFSYSKDSLVLFLCTAGICILALARPYYAVFFLIPLWKSLQDKRKKWLVGLPLLAIVVMALFFLNSHYFCATYFSNVLSFEKIRQAGISGFFVNLFEGFVSILRQVWYAIRYKGAGIGWYYLLLGIELLVMFFVCVKNVCYHKKKCPPMFVVALIGDLLILVSIIEMYDLSGGARHVLALIIMNAVLLIQEYHGSVGLVLALVCVLSTVQTGDADGLPYRNREYVEYMNALEKKFSEVVEVTEEISYDNVVAMPTADVDAQDPTRGVSAYYGLMFAMPAGVGISLDYQDFYDEPENIKAGYILVHPSGTIRQILEREGMVCVFENDEMALYAR